MKITIELNSCTGKIQDNKNRLVFRRMGKHEASTRRAWLEYHGNEVQGDV